MSSSPEAKIDWATHDLDISADFFGDRNGSKTYGYGWPVPIEACPHSYTYNTIPMTAMEEWREENTLRTVYCVNCISSCSCQRPQCQSNIWSVQQVCLVVTINSLCTFLIILYTCVSMTAKRIAWRNNCGLIIAHLCAVCHNHSGIHWQTYVWVLMWYGYT